MSASPLKVFIVDASSLRRRAVRDLIAQERGVEYVGAASVLRLAREKIRTFRPDVLLIGAGQPGAETFQTDTPEPLPLVGYEDLDNLRAELRRLLSARVGSERRRTRADAPGENQTPPIVDRLPPSVVCIGVSTGGPDALQVVLPALPADFPAPVLVVQHMPKGFTRSLAEDLDRRCALRVAEACDGSRLEPGRIFIAPGGCQMKVVREGERFVVRVTDDPPEQNCRPSVDYLFRSAAEAFGDRTLAVVMTGMGSDGVFGCESLKNCGATVLCQSARTCVVYGMPRAVTERGLADASIDLCELAGSVVDLVCGSSTPC